MCVTCKTTNGRFTCFKIDIKTQGQQTLQTQFAGLQGHIGLGFNGRAQGSKLWGLGVRTAAQIQGRLDAREMGNLLGDVKRLAP